MKTSTRTTVVLAVVALVAAALVVTSPPADPAGRPDVTYVACSAWSNHNPGFTSTTRCWTPSGLVAVHRNLDCENASYNVNGLSRELDLTQDLQQICNK